MLSNTPLLATLLAALSTTANTTNSLLTRTAAAPGTFAQYGAPGIVSMKSYTSDPAGGRCDNPPAGPKKPSGKLIRLPSLWLNGTWNCGREVTIYYYPKTGDKEWQLPALAATEAHVWGACDVDCQDGSVMVAEDMFDLFGVTDDGEKARGFWGPAVVWLGLSPLDPGYRAPVNMGTA